MDSLIQDLKFSLRLMRKRPGMTFLVIAALMLGIGLNTAIFSVVNAVLLRPLPLFQPERVVRIFAKVNRTGATFGISYPEYLDWKAQSRSFDAIAVMRPMSFTMTGSGPPEHLAGTALSASGFRAWGIGTALGRGFTEDDDRSDSIRVVVLSHAFWQRKFGGDSSVLGRTLVLDEQPYIIIGVLEPTQIGILGYPAVWVANGPQLDQLMMRRDNRYYFPVARLEPHATVTEARAEIEAIANRLAIQHPDTNKDMGVVLASETDLLTADGRKPLWMLIAASSLIFLLAAVNVMTVLMGNTVERSRELGVRLALGAARWSLLRQLLTQAMVFALAGGALGLLLAKVGLLWFLHRFPDVVFRLQETTIDFRVVLATLAMTLLVSFVASLLPALYAMNLNPTRDLTGAWNSLPAPKYRALGRAALIILEISLASGLTLVSGLLIRSLYEVEKVNLGFEPSRVFSFQINPPSARYKERAKRSALYRAVLEKLAGPPGIKSASAISNLPLTAQAEANTLEADGQSPLAGQHLQIEEESVLPGFFQTLGAPLLQGRDFTASDNDGAPPVVIVDDVLAAKLWPGQSALGKRVRMTVFRGETARWLEVVGVVKEIKRFGPERAVRWLQAYVPQYQDPTLILSFVIRTPAPPSTVKAEAGKALQEVDKDLPLENFETMDTYLDRFLNGRKVSVVLLGAFAAIGIMLGVIGIYGVVAGVVVQRRRELAIRMAVGARFSSALALVARLGILAAVAGVVIGSAMVAALTRILASLLFGVSAMEPRIYVLCAVLFVLLAALAGVIPAMPVARFNIQEILRQ